MPAYMTTQVKVKDKEKFQSYLAATQPVAAKFGGKPVVLGAQPTMLLGTNQDHEMMFVIEFPSMEKLNAWHDSEDYKALGPLRDEGSDQHMMAYEGMDGPPS
ncbi:DUF1330 domain-containing protein [Roseobacteraceae bacterium S113]